MRQYQTAQLTNISGGLTDNFKENGLMFNRYLNFIPTPHGSAKLRRGAIPFCKADNGTTDNDSVRAIGRIKTLKSDFKVAVVGDKIMNKSKARFNVVPFSTDNECFPLIMPDDVATTSEWRDALIINTDSDDEAVMVNAIDGEKITANIASLPEVTGAAGITTGDRLYAVCIVRTYVSANGYTYKDYSPELIGKTNSTVNITAITPEIYPTVATSSNEISRAGTSATVDIGEYKLSIGAYVKITNDAGNLITATVLDFIVGPPNTAILEFESQDDIDSITSLTGSPLKYSKYGRDLSYALFLSVPNGTSLYLAEESDTLPLAYTATTEKDKELEKSESGFFLSEEVKRQVPINKHTFNVGDTFYYANVLESNGERRGNRVYQSVQGMPTSVLASGYVDFDGEVLGGGKANGVPIVLTEASVYRLDGVIGVDGSGNIRRQVVAGSNGGISHKSIVTTESHAYYAGTDGIYRTDGYNAVNITGDRLYKTYSELVSDRDNWRKIHGTFDRDNNLIYWRFDSRTVYVYNITTGTFGELEYNSSNSAGIVSISSFADVNRAKLANILDNGVYDITGYVVEFTVDSRIRYAEDDSVLLHDKTTGSNYAGVVSYIDDSTDPTVAKVTVRFSPDITPPTGNLVGFEIYMDEGKAGPRIYFGMGDGLIKYSDESVYHDSRDLSPDDTDVLYIRESIPFDLLSAGVSYGDNHGKKWVKSLTVNMEANSRLSVAPYVIVDNNYDEAYMATIRNRGQFMAFDSGDISNREGRSCFPDSVRRNTRHLPRNYNLCWYNQLGIKSVDSDIMNSVDYSTMTMKEEIDIGPYKVKRFMLDVKDYTATIKIERDADRFGNGTLMFLIGSAVLSVGDVVTLDTPDGYIMSVVKEFTVTTQGNSIIVYLGSDWTKYDYLSWPSFTGKYLYDPIQIRFPRDMVGRSISLAKKGDKVDSLSSRIDAINLTRTEIDVIVNPDMASILVNDTVDWIVYGTPIDQSFEVISMAIDFAPVGGYGAGANRRDSSESKYE